MPTIVTNKALLNEWLAFMAAHPNVQQFGQSDDESTFNGSTGCTHTILQLYILALKGHLYSHDEISKIAGYPWPANNRAMRGMRTSTDPNSEFMKVVRHFGLPLRPVFFSSNLTEDIFQWLNRVSNTRGPALVGIKYDWYPEHRGTVYMGHTADGKPNGYALRNGATQLTGFTGAHATLRLGFAEWPADGSWRTYWREPNHHSPSRPERPGFDVFLTKQERPLIQSYRRLTVGGKPRSLFFVAPTVMIHPR